MPCAGSRPVSPKGPTSISCKAFWVRQEYDQVENEVWMLTQDELVVDLNVLRTPANRTRTPCKVSTDRRTATYRNFLINQIQDDAFYSGPEEVVMAIDPLSLGADYWEQNRHVPLTEKENAIYHMVDTMKTIPRFRTYIDIVQTVVTGYYPMGMIELGPYFTTYSCNLVEGNRFRMGARTSSQFSRRVEFEGYTGLWYAWTRNSSTVSVGRASSPRHPRLIVGVYLQARYRAVGPEHEGLPAGQHPVLRCSGECPTISSPWWTSTRSIWSVNGSWASAIRSCSSYRTMSPARVVWPMSV